jgi:hypothetical protein
LVFEGDIMPFYSAYLPPDDGMGADSAAALSRAVVLKDGFSFPAFLFTGLWLLSKKLWIGFLAFAVIYGVLMLLRAELGLAAPALGAAQFALGLFLGLEGHHLWGSKLMANGWTQADVVEARNQDEAERRFFERALQRQAGTGLLPVPYVAPSAPAPSFARPMSSQVIGMFPEGSSR